MSGEATGTGAVRPISFYPVLPGLLLCIAVGAIAQLLGSVEAELTGRAWLEPLVLAILLGAFVRNTLPIGSRMSPGIKFSAKTLLDIAVAMLGASLSVRALEGLGAITFLLIASLVLLALGGAFLIGRLLGLGRRLAVLIAVGNSICGNSAIAAVAPIIKATQDEIAASISLTALNGVVVVLLLPAAVYVFGMSTQRYALLTGLTVYAVPQVIAAAAPFGTGVVTLATFVKLARVLLLGPVTLLLSILVRRSALMSDQHVAGRPTFPVPWFIVVFLALALLRWAGLIPAPWITGFGFLANLFAVVAMAALGFGVRFASLFEVGPRVALTTVGATLWIMVLATVVVHLVP